MEKREHTRRKKENIINTGIVWISQLPCVHFAFGFHFTADRGESVSHLFFMYHFGGS
jgi:hypothetical protein